MTDNDNASKQLTLTNQMNYDTVICSCIVAGSVEGIGVMRHIYMATIESTRVYQDPINTILLDHILSLHGQPGATRPVIILLKQGAIIGIHICIHIMYMYSKYLLTSI